MLAAMVSDALTEWMAILGTISLLLLPVWLWQLRSNRGKP